MDSRKEWFGEQLDLPLSSDFEGSCARERESAVEPTLELVPGGASESAPPVLSDELLDAWRANARCVECGRLVDAPHDAAFLVAARRIAHTATCFLPALLRRHPSLKRLSTRTRTARTGEVVPHHDENGNA
ncbi:MAG TPA: hypothetical protein VJ672_12655 [Gemmatimonadaceae bacterium]|nr:hypothetical protein [Gemmatimonadaceae bacterium]